MGLVWGGKRVGRSGRGEECGGVIHRVETRVILRDMN